HEAPVEHAVARRRRRIRLSRRGAEEASGVDAEARSRMAVAFGNGAPSALASLSAAQSGLSRPIGRSEDRFAARTAGAAEEGTSEGVPRLGTRVPPHRPAVHLELLLEIPVLVEPCLSAGIGHLIPRRPGADDSDVPADGGDQVRESGFVVLSE